MSGDTSSVAPTPDDAVLPAAFADMTDGDRLAAKVGHTFLLVVCEESGWPRVAVLSVGEVLATGPRRVHLALHATSGTSSALRAAGRALLYTVVDRRAIKVRLTTEVAADPTPSDPRIYFVADIEDVAADAVGYATLVDGVRYELTDPPSVIERWESTIDRMRGLNSSRLPEQR